MYRKWFGNLEFVVNWQNAGEELYNFAKQLYGSPTRIIKNADYYFREGITWSDVTSGSTAFRYMPKGTIFDATAHCAFFDSMEEQFTYLAYLNTKVIDLLVSILNPTLHFHVGYFRMLPSLSKNLSAHRSIALSALEIAKNDWNFYKTSWDFSILPLLTPNLHKASLQNHYAGLRESWHKMALEIQQLEEENNRIFIEAYGLQDELKPDVPIEEITLTCNPYYRYGGNKTDEELEAQLQTDTIKELISYAIGCMMGRYSLDQPGLIYAHEGNIGFAPERYKTFPADDDAIIPVMDRDWFEDEATHRFVAFVKTAWPEQYLDENLRFVAESLGPKNNEAPVETIRRYISTTFFKDHLRMYKRRPIYWLFSSGKHKAFECLVYLHRYNESTLSRMRSLYVTPLQGNFSARMQYLQNELDAAPSASAKKKLQKEMDLLGKKQTELAAFDDQLRHLADQKIILDLDDGVKVNYGKFGTLLAETKAVTGKK